jgi:hypothetical protein
MERTPKYDSDVSVKTIEQDTLWDLDFTNAEPFVTLKFPGCPSQSIQLSPSNNGNWKASRRIEVEPTRDLHMCAAAFWKYSHDFPFIVDFWLIEVGHRICLLINSN